jgi:hypothetical protein
VRRARRAGDRRRPRARTTANRRRSAAHLISRPRR